MTVSKYLPVSIYFAVLTVLVTVFYANINYNRTKAAKVLAEHGYTNIVVTDLDCYNKYSGYTFTFSAFKAQRQISGQVRVDNWGYSDITVK